MSPGVENDDNGSLWFSEEKNRSNKRTARFSLRNWLFRRDEKKKVFGLTKSKSVEEGYEGRKLVPKSKSCDSGVAAYLISPRNKETCKSSSVILKKVPSMIKKSSTSCGRDCLKVPSATKMLKTSFSSGDICKSWSSPKIGQHSGPKITKCTSQHNIKPKNFDLYSGRVHPLKETLSVSDLFLQAAASSQDLSAISLQKVSPERDSNPLDSNAINHLVLCKLCLMMVPQGTLYQLKECGCSFCEMEPVTALSYNGASHLVFVSSIDNIREPKPSVPALSTNISDEHKPHEERGQWGNKAEFILSCIGLSVGIGNVWRFPYLAYQNGGGAFLLPYIILLVLVGKPMYYMEVALGQFSSLGPMSVWRCFPLGKGIGAAMVVISLLVAIYYNVIMGYCLYYMGQSFRSEVPWNGCHEWWGADNTICYVRDGVDRCPVALDKLASEYLGTFNMSTLTDMSDELVNVTLSNKTASILVPQERFHSTLQNCTNATQTASEHFWGRYVLDITGGIEDIGTVKWDLAVCLLVSWVIVFLCLMKGVKSSGKVVYFTATFPYVILIILLIRGLMLDGAVTGLRYFFIPEWKKLLDITVWRAAAEQLFFSLSVSWGGLIMFGSYNKFHNKVHRDAMFVSSLDFITSLIAGIVIFSVLGNMSDKLGIDIKDVVEGGQGLAFVAYPEALSHLPLPQIWSVLFFFMLFLLGLDSEFALLEVFLTAIYDEFPKMRNKKVLLTFICCSICFFLGLPCVTQGGQYILNLMDTYGGGFAVTFIAICELLALMWGYGIRRFCDDLQFMLHIRPNIFWKACWLVISPLVLAFIFIYSLSQHEIIKYGDYYQYPQWADGIGWIFALISMIQIPVWGIAILLWNIRNVKKVINPDARWGPTDPEIRQQYFQKKTNGFVMSEKDNRGLDNLGLTI